MTAISVSISGGNHSASGTKPKAEAISEIECATVNDGDDDHERPQPPERDHEAEQEEQVVGALEDVPEARLDEAQRGLVPARIETHEARDRRGTRRRARRRPGGRKRNAVETFCPSRSTRGSDRELRNGRSGSDIRAARRAAAGSSRGRDRSQAAGLDVRARLLVGRERAVGGQRHARVDDARRRQRRAVFVKRRCCRSDRASRRCAAPRRRARCRDSRDRGSGKSTSIMAASGTRIRSSSLWPSGLTNALILTSVGMSCAAARHAATDERPSDGAHERGARPAR